MPQPCGMTTPSTALVAIAASTAVPPAQDVQPGRRREVVGRHDRAVAPAGQRHRCPGPPLRVGGPAAHEAVGASRFDGLPIVS